MPTNDNTGFIWRTNNLQKCGKCRHKVTFWRLRIIDHIFVLIIRHAKCTFTTKFYCSVWYHLNYTAGKSKVLSFILRSIIYILPLFTMFIVIVKWAAWFSEKVYLTWI